ncbi:MAG: iron-containing redox enzyme family protein [Methylomicrobium sp.]
MNEFANPFNPHLKPVFSKTAYRAAQHYRQNGRDLFHALMQSGEKPALYPLAYHFIELHLSRKVLSAPCPLPLSWDNESILQALQTQESPLLPTALTLDQFRDGLSQVQPVILTEPCWLQNILQTATNQTSVAIALSAVYSSSGALNTPDKLFQALLLEAGLEIPDLSSSAFPQQETIEELFFDFAAVQLALAQFPRGYFPELLGFTLAWCNSRSLLEAFAGAEHSKLQPYLRHRRNRLSSTKAVVTDAIRNYLGQFESFKTELWRRITAGFDLYRDCFEQCERRLQIRLAEPETAFQSAARMLTDKAPIAFGHHRDVKLEGRPLDEWFAEQPFDSQKFLAALHRSSYVDRQNPAASPLLKLFEFEGPMFGVLTESDKNCLKRWLNEEDKGLSAPPCPSPPLSETNWLPEKRGVDPPAFAHKSHRELYHYLVNADLYPDVLPAARRVVERVLRVSRWFNRSPFKKYTHPTFATYIDTLYQREAKAYEPLEGSPRLSRQAYVWGIEQLAPAILTDGCWLQQVSRLRFTSHAAVGRALYKTYDDETGNGIEAQNHPLIYRQLLDSLHITLPPIHDRAFCDYPGFIDSAFDIPVYLMAISKFPASFLPELLGLNMAIELSGLGRIYLRLAQELRFWGIDPKIVNVHISIDNLASGHAALARNAIQHYLDQIAANHGEDAKEAHWRRIYHGYCSLATAGRVFKIALVVFYLYRQFKSQYTGRHLFTHRSDQNV